MGTIIEFPADAASRRSGSTFDGASHGGMGTVLILPVIRIERETDGTHGGAGRKRARRRAVVGAVADASGIRSCRRRAFPIRYFAPVLLLLAGGMLGACSGGDFGRTREDFRNDDMHRWIGA